MVAAACTPLGMIPCSAAMAVVLVGMTVHLQERTMILLVLGMFRRISAVARNSRVDPEEASAEALPTTLSVDLGVMTSSEAKVLAYMEMQVCNPEANWAMRTGVISLQ